MPILNIYYFSYAGYDKDKINGGKFVVEIKMLEY